jgi:hypothetical protein
MNADEGETMTEKRRTDAALSRRSILTIATGGVAAAALIRPGAAAAATDSYDVPTLSTMGSLGVTPNETARLSLVMHADNPAGWMLCNGFLSFINMAGKQVASTKFQLQAGQGAHLDWSPTGKLHRTQVYPLVTVTTDMSAGDYTQVVMGATFEIFDRSTLATRAAVVGVLRAIPVVAG